MKQEEIDSLIEQYDAVHKIANQGDASLEPKSGEEWPTMYDNKSALVNYALIRHFKPRVVVEYGAFKGRVTHDILQALLDNEKPYVFKSYEIIEHNRVLAQNALNNIFKDKAITIGQDVMEAKDLPKSIDYLFLDHDHDYKVSEWTWDNLIPRVKKGGIIQIHDIPLKGDYQLGKVDGVFPETRQIIDMHNQGTLPFEKLYWLFEENGSEGSWWVKI